MKIAIDQVRTEEGTRIRQDVGNISSLEESIDTVGLINPIIIDEEMKLLAGFRRLTACKNLGWEKIEVRIVELNGDRLKMLDVEVAENFFRKDFTPEEVLATEKRRNEILEELREKGIFERFWLWLKSLFAPKSTSVESSAERQTPDKIAAATVSLSESEKPVSEKPPVAPVSATGDGETAESTATAPADVSEAGAPAEGSQK